MSAQLNRKGVTGETWVPPVPSLPTAAPGQQVTGETWVPPAPGLSALRVEE